MRRCSGGCSSPGHSGVDLFFVLSGFIILLVHRRDIGPPRRIARYAWRRFVRVWPLYWLALVATVAKRMASGDVAPNPASFAWNLALLPTAGEPMMGIAWTLQYEAVFYLPFGLLLVERRLGTVALVAWLALVLLVPQGVGAAGVFAVEFAFGMAAAVLVRRGSVPRPLLVTAAGGGLFALAWVAETAGVLDGYGAAARFAYGLPAAMVVAGIASARPAVPRMLARLGSASYAVYLFHLLGIGAAWQLLGRLGVAMPTTAWFVVLAASGVTAGLIVHRLIERPLLARLRR